MYKSISYQKLKHSVLVGEYGNLQCLYDGLDNFSSAGIRSSHDGELYLSDQPDSVLEPVFEGMTPTEFGLACGKVLFECDCEFGTGLRSTDSSRCVDQCGVKFRVIV